MEAHKFRSGKWRKGSSEYEFLINSGGSAADYPRESKVVSHKLMESLLLSCRIFLLAFLTKEKQQDNEESPYFQRHRERVQQQGVWLTSRSHHRWKMFPMTSGKKSPDQKQRNNKERGDYDRDEIICRFSLSDQSRFEKLTLSSWSSAFLTKGRS